MFPFDRDGLKEKLNEINKKTEAEDFWKDQETAQKLLKEKKAIEVKLQEYSRLEEEFSDVETLILMAEEEDDESLLPEIEATYRQLNKDIDDMTVKVLLSGEYDINNAIISIHAGSACARPSFPSSAL